MVASERRLVLDVSGHAQLRALPTNPIGGWNQALGRQHAGSWAAGNSFGADKFGNRLTIVLRHDLPCVVTDQRASRDCGIRRLPRRCFFGGI